jgi:hypothetical protein
MVNDGVLYSESNSVDYNQYSNVILKKELNFKASKTYLFSKIHSSEKTSHSFVFTFLKFKDVYSHQISELLKLRTQLYQKVSSLLTYFIFVNEIISSKNTCKNLYIA